MGDVNDQAWEAPGPGPWMQDRAHLPASVTPLLQEIYPRAFAAGFSAALDPYGVLLDTMHARVRQRVPLHATGAVRRAGPRRSEVAGAARRRDRSSHGAGRRGLREPDLARHPEVLGRRGKAGSIARHRELAGVDLPSLSDERAAEPTSTSAWSTCRRCGSSTTRTTPLRCVPVGDFVLHAAGWTARRPSADVRGLRRLVAGLGSCSTPRSLPAIEALPRRSRRRGVADRRRRLRLSASRSCASKCQPSTSTSAASGFRIAAGFDLTNPTVVERPDLVLGRLAAAFGYDTDHSTKRAPTHSPPSSASRRPRGSAGRVRRPARPRRASCIACATSAVSTATRPRSA